MSLHFWTMLINLRCSTLRVIDSENFITSLCFSPDGLYLATGEGVSFIHVSTLVCLTLIIFRMFLDLGDI